MTPSSPAAEVGLPPLPSLVVGRLLHRRRGAVHHAFRHDLNLWLIDVDDIPRFRPPISWLASFRPVRHLAGHHGSLRSAVEELLAAHRLEIGPGGRIVMLAGAATLGHLFDPLSVFWCLDGGGRVVAIVAEVHNTYGEAHSYVLTPDGSGSARARKTFYVSPFYRVSGDYAMRFALSPQRVSVTVRLHCDGDTAGRPDFVATFNGRPGPATARAVLRAAARRPLMAQRVSALIRLHGVWLWRRLPVVPRPGRSAGGPE